LLEKLSKNSKVIEGLQSDIIAVKEYASDLQSFLGSKVIEEEVLKEPMLSINVDVLDVLIISWIDKSPTQSL
jgi:hypothetical protein